MSSSTSILVLSGSDVDKLTQSLSANSLIKMLGATMHAISFSTNTEVMPAPIQNPIRIATETQLHKTLYMPSRLSTSSSSTTSIKIVAVPTQSNTKAAGLPASTFLLDETTGKLKAVINAGELTGIRTAAASALATKLLALPNSKVLVLFGTGTQAYYHARLIFELLPSLTSCYFVGREYDQRAENLVARIRSHMSKNGKESQIDFQWISRDASLVDILRSADIICTCVPSISPLFRASDLNSTVHINAIGSYTPKMFEFPPTLISPILSLPSPAPIPIILVDSKTAVLTEAGELIDAKITSNELIEIGELVDEFGEVSGGNIEIEDKKKLLRKGGMSLFKCVGVGGMDSAIAELVYQKAVELKIGTLVDY